uniref:SURF6 domain-containing protein n=1 Tax=Strongyloides papillosus TaxID=174720 RepID=A0A0N5BYU0_STREA
MFSVFENKVKCGRNVQAHDVVYKRGDKDFENKEIFKIIRLYDKMRYEKKVKKMTKSELAEFRAKNFYSKKWRDRKTEKERVSKIRWNSKMRTERHRTMTEEDRSEYNRNVRKRKQKKKEVAEKLETLLKDSSEYKQLLKAEKVKKGKKQKIIDNGKEKLKKWLLPWPC